MGGGGRGDGGGEREKAEGARGDMYWKVCVREECFVYLLKAGGSCLCWCVGFLLVSAHSNLASTHRR